MTTKSALPEETFNIWRAAVDGPPEGRTDDPQQVWEIVGLLLTENERLRAERLVSAAAAVPDPPAIGG